MMVSFTSDDSNKLSHLDGYMMKWKPRGVSVARDFPPGCRPIIPKAEEHGAGKNVELVATNSQIRVAGKDTNSGFGCQSHESETNLAGGVDIKDSLDVPVMPGVDGIPVTASMGDEVEAPGTDGTLNAKWKLRKVSAVRDFPPGCGPNPMPINLKARECGARMNIDLVERNTGSLGVEIESSETNGKLNAGERSGCLQNYCDVGFDCRAHESEISPAWGVERLTTSAYGVEDHVMITGPSEMPLQNEVNGRSHLLSSARDNIKPVKLKIKLCHREASAVRELPQIHGINLSLRNNEVEPEVDEFLDNDEIIEDKPQASLLNGLHAVIGYGLEGVGRSHGKNILVSSPNGKDKVIPRGTDFTAGKEMGREIVYGLMAAPYCPWRTGNVSVDNAASTGKKQTKRKSINSCPDKPSGGPYKRRAFLDHTDRNPGSSNILDTGDGGAFTKRRTYINPISMLNPKIDDSPGKSCDVSLWLNKSKAVARKTICRGNFSGNKTKEDFPKDSSLVSKRKNCDIRLLPQFGPNNHNRGNARSRVRETLMLFSSTCRKLLQKEEANSEKSKKLFRVDLEAAKTIKNKGKEVNTGKHILGSVPGVEVGDEFQYRVELAIVGIHRLYQAGIDSMNLDGILVATSIVTSGSYDDDTEHADVLIYTGQGGNIVGKNKNYEDQKLEKGNLALSNSIKRRTPVRVVRGWRETITGIGPSDSRPKLVTIYYYDGLYTVQRYWEEESSHGTMVFKFELTRNPGQPELAWKELKKASKSKFRRGLCVTDISRGSEKFPICAVNELDDDKPPRFTYISKMKYPNWHRPSPPIGCNCVGKCNSSGKCACGIRNGGKIPYTYNGCIVEDKLVVYECGPHCTCPPTCYNRVSQHGIKFKLEIFKTKRRGWGLRSLTSIPSGGFVCEYVGEVSDDSEAEKRVGNDDYLFDIGQNILDSSLKNEEAAVSVAEEGGYTIDACHLGNVGRFINHSCSPNLYAQNVIHDHDDKKMPHIMLFARENIPAFQELTYHYNYKLDQVFHPDGNIKTKKCFCGSTECRGRMY